MDRRIAILAEQFFKMDGSESLMGGGERYLFDLYNLLRNNGYYVEVYQFSYTPWVKRYDGMKVTGLGEMTKNHSIEGYINTLDKFEEKTKNCNGYITLSMNLMLRKYAKPTMTISHGLMIDGNEPGIKLKPTLNLDGLKKWVRNADKMISVDTNTKKVLQCWYPELVGKIEYIPNYVDLEQFGKLENTDNKKFNILYPRRLQWCRGYMTMMEAAERLLEKHDDITVTFCGRGNQKEKDLFAAWNNHIISRGFGNRVNKVSFEMKDMPNVYKNMHLSCVPTIYAEGTSLSVLESQASGVPVIATIVGGLTDLILNDYNGLLINADDKWSFDEVNSDYLFDAIERLYLDREELKFLRDNALETVKMFSKEKWDKRILKAVNSIFQ